MKNIFGGIFLACVVVWGGAVSGQTHKVESPLSVVRAVGVYEWTGDMAKPTASRLIPVSLFIEGKLEEAGVYLARPVPFALLSGNVYELQQAGVAKGTLNLVYARHMQVEDTSTGATAFDDGWFGYGSYRGLTAAKKSGSALKPSTTLAVVKGSRDGDRPHFANKTGETSAGGDSGQESKSTGKAAEDADRPTMRRRDSGSGDSAKSTGAAKTDSSTASVDKTTPADDPDRPTMKRRSTGDAGGDTASGTGGAKQDSSAANTDKANTDKTTPADDPDRPTMKRRDSSDTGSDTTATKGDTPADDADRPTLKHHSAEQSKKERGRDDTASVSGVGSLNDDPNRPNLHRGKPASAMTEADLPKLTGMPKEIELHQMVAVSDAANSETHDFARAWEDDAERKVILGKMQVLAQKKLLSYNLASSAAAAAAKPVGKRPPNSKLRHAVGPEIASAVPVVEEELKGYALSYGGDVTYVYTAHTVGTGASLEYVTEVAQAGAMGELKPAIESVTDAAHLDRNPRMRLVDAVDADASNRASLLFELRGQSSRQFALYRVIGSVAEQVFLTGTTQ